MRPRVYWRRFQALWGMIVLSLLLKAMHGRWLGCFSRQRQQYWWKGLLKQSARLNNVMGIVALVTFITSMSGLLILSTHSTDYYEIRAVSGPPHVSFAVTPVSVFG